MADVGKTFAGAIPAIYERYLVPLIFEPYARDMADRVAAAMPDAILETAAGTGALTRAIASALPQARITATDLNQGMLDRATSRPSSIDPRIIWKQADAMALPLDDQSVDLVVCQFGVMFFPDKVAAHKEARRVLKPGGHLMFNVWDDLSHNPFPRTVLDALKHLFPNDPPRFMERIPHGYHDRDVISADLKAAGLSDIRIESVDAICTADLARDVAMGFCQGTPMRGEIEAQGGQRLEEATQFVADAVALRFGAGPIEAPIRALVVSAAP